MRENVRSTGQVRERDADAADDEWGIVNPAMRAMLDHLAEELAAEFIRLIKAASEDARSTPQGDKKTR